MRPFLREIGDEVGDLLDVVENLGDQDDVGAAGDPGVERDMAGVATHHLQHHHPVVAGGGRLQTVERIDCRGDGRVEADGPFGEGDVVVDGLRNADELDTALLGQTAEDTHAAVAADGDQGIESQFLEPFDDLVGAVLGGTVGHRIGKGVPLVHRAEDGAAHAQDVPGEDPHPHLFDQGRPLEKAGRAFVNSDNFPAVSVYGPAYDRADRGIQAGAISAAGQQSNLFL